MILTTKLREKRISHLQQNTKIHFEVKRKIVPTGLWGSGCFLFGTEKCAPFSRNLAWIFSLTVTFSLWLQFPAGWNCPICPTLLPVAMLLLTESNCKLKEKHVTRIALQCDHFNRKSIIWLLWKNKCSKMIIWWNQVNLCDEIDYIQISSFQIKKKPVSWVIDLHPKLSTNWGTKKPKSTCWAKRT